MHRTMHRAVCRTERCTLHRTSYRMRASQRATRSAPHDARGCTTDTAALAAAASRGAQGAAAEGAVRRARAPDQPVSAARGDAGRDPSAQRRARPTSVSLKRRAPVPTRLTRPRPPPGAAARPPVSRPDLFVHLRERPGAQLGSSATARPVGHVAPPRPWCGPELRLEGLCSDARPKCGGWPRSPDPDTRDREMSNARPPDHQSTGHQDPPGLTRVHVPARASPDPLPPTRSPSRPKARRRRRSSSYARSASPASRMRCTTCSRGRPKRRCCVCERATAASRRCRGVPAGVAG